MANKTLTITAPEELIEATIVAFAAKGDKEDESVSDEAHAIDMMLASFRELVVSHNAQLRTAASRAADRAAQQAEDEALKSQRDAVTVTIE